MPKIINNFLTNEEIISLYLAFSLELDNAVLSQDTGRKIVVSQHLILNENSPIKNIFKKVEEYVSNEYNKKMKTATFGIHYYSPKFGTPKLLPHIDDFAGQVVFDYQIASNIVWPLIVNEQRYVLKNNDALIFEGEKDGHWRQKITFLDDSFVLMFIVNLIDDEHWFNFSNQNPKSIDLINQEIKELRIKNNYLE
jgi:hypothetical protein